MTWSGLDKAPKKGLNLDFFHTPDGSPCYIGHDDGYYDARQRFLMIVGRMRWLIEATARPLTFVQDRGFWGDEFMKAMIDEGKVKPNMGRKALVDAVRVTSRNVFCEAHRLFRPIYDNYREDHVTLRQLTQSPGVITQAENGTVNVYLTPQLDRQPAQWRRIRTFLDIVEHRIRQQFATIVKFHVEKTSAEIFDAAHRMKTRLKS